MVHNITSTQNYFPPLNTTTNNILKDKFLREMGKIISYDPKSCFPKCSEMLNLNRSRDLWISIMSDSFTSTRKISNSKKIPTITTNHFPSLIVQQVRKSNHEPTFDKYSVRVWTTVYIIQYNNSNIIFIKYLIESMVNKTKLQTI